MPKIHAASDDDFVASVLSARAIFAAGFHRSRRGNLWRNWEGKTLTVFEREKHFGWCIADADGPCYSRRPFESEADAITALAKALGVGE